MSGNFPNFVPCFVSNVGWFYFVLDGDLVKIGEVETLEYFLVQNRGLVGCILSRMFNLVEAGELTSFTLPYPILLFDRF